MFLKLFEKNINPFNQSENKKSVGQPAYVQEQTTSQTQKKLTVHVCRKSSFYQGFSSAGLSINWEDIGEINSNEIYTIFTPQFDILQIGLVLPRDSLFKERKKINRSLGTPTNESFIVISVENTTPVGLSVGMTAIFGAIGATPDLEWRVQSVSESDFQEACPKAKSLFFKHHTL